MYFFGDLSLTKLQLSPSRVSMIVQSVIVIKFHVCRFNWLCMYTKINKMEQKERIVGGLIFCCVGVSFMIGVDFIFAFI